MDSRIFANQSLWQLWTYCLMKANHKDQWVSMTVGKGETEIQVKAGQFVFGRNTWAKKLKIKPSTLWNQMQKLKKLQYLDMQSNNTCTIVTIMNWKLYQQRENEKEQPFEHRTENELKTNYKPSNTDNNDKNVNNDNKYIHEFNSFWNLYPSRNGKKLEKGVCLKLFKDLKKDDLPKILEAVKNYTDSKQIKDGIGIKDPKRFIRNDFWKEWIVPEDAVEDQEEDVAEAANRVVEESK